MVSAAISRMIMNRRSEPINFCTLELQIANLNLTPCIFYNCVFCGLRRQKDKTLAYAHSNSNYWWRRSVVVGALASINVVN